MKFIGFITAFLAWVGLQSNFSFEDLFLLILGVAIVMGEEILARVEILFRRNHNE